MRFKPCAILNCTMHFSPTLTYNGNLRDLIESAESIVCNTSKCIPILFMYKVTNHASHLVAGSLKSSNLTHYLSTIRARWSVFDACRDLLSRTKFLTRAAHPDYRRQCTASDDSLEHHGRSSGLADVGECGHPLSSPCGRKYVVQCISPCSLQVGAKREVV
jgi:hypothetical protein